MILKKSLLGGKYMTHCNGINAEAAIQLYESLLKSLGVPLEFTQTRAYVPSFQVSKRLGVPLEFTQTLAYVPSFQVGICHVLTCNPNRSE
jgi:hypothetical protein